MTRGYEGHGGVQPLSDVTSSHSCSFNKYADDTELSKSSIPASFSSVQLSVQNCITDILLWMNSNKLKLNPEKNRSYESWVQIPPRANYYQFNGYK